MSNLNNDQRIRKGHKNVQALGTTASTILAYEFMTLLTKRIKEIEKVIEFNEDVNEEIKRLKRDVKRYNINNNEGLHPLEAKEYIEKAENKFKGCSEFVTYGFASNQSTLKVLETFLTTIKH
tara:strand:+ start:448 stop:813 length:366 start_codon:yes stop_codon:yes gene_type:complete